MTKNDRNKRTLTVLLVVLCLVVWFAIHELINMVS